MMQENWTSAENIYNTVVLQHSDRGSSPESKIKKRSPQTESDDVEHFLVQVEPEYIPEYPDYLTFMPTPGNNDMQKVSFDNYPSPQIVQESFGLGAGVVSGYLYQEESIAVISIPSF